MSVSNGLLTGWGEVYTSIKGADKRRQNNYKLVFQDERESRENTQSSRSLPFIPTDLSTGLLIFISDLIAAWFS